MLNEELDQLPWYKQFWPWFLIALPLSVVIAGFTTMFIAHTNAVSLVSDDYYKDGLAINSMLELQKTAAALNLSAELLLSSETNSCTIQLNGQHNQPAYLKLHLSHPTLGSIDQTILLKKAAEGIYQLNCSLPLPGKWYVSIQDPDASWEIKYAALLPNL